jgi:acetamidase/formamidase
MTTVLQPHEGAIRSDTYLPADPAQVLWGRLPCATDRPVLTIAEGTEVTIDTISHEGILEDQGRDPRRFFDGHEVLDDAVDLAASSCDRGDGGPHVVTGPIHVEGARPGDLLRMRVVETLQRVPYGVISNRHGRGALPEEYPASGETVSIFAESDGEWGSLPTAGRPVRFKLHPFLGIMGVAVNDDRRPHSVPPGPHGGNIDINLLTVGSALYLPVQVEGALAYVGDPHFAQGDGEVALTAMEASLRATIGFDVIPAVDAVEAFGELVGPLAETADFLIPTGMNEDLDLAMQDCVRAAIALLQARWGMDPAHAYAYLSAATDFNISQVVDLVKGVHARVRKSDFEF